MDILANRRTQGAGRSLDRSNMGIINIMLKYCLATLDADKGAIAVLQSHMSGARALWYYHAAKHANSQNLHSMCCKALKQSFEFRHPSL